MEADRPVQPGSEETPGRILSVRIRQADGSRLEVAKREFSVSDDARAVSLFTARGRAERASDRARGLCFDRYTEDITLDLPPGHRLLPGTRITVYSGADAGEGAAEAPILEVSEVRKRCFPECERPDKGGCPLRRHAAFARVIQGGRLASGTAVHVSGGDPRSPGGATREAD